MESSKKMLLALGLALSVIGSGNVWAMEDYATTVDINTLLTSLKDFDKNKAFGEILHPVTDEWIIREGNELSSLIERVTNNIIKSNGIQKDPSYALKELEKAKEEFNDFIKLVNGALSNEDNREEKQRLAKVRDYCQSYLDRVEMLIQLI